MIDKIIALITCCISVVLFTPLVGVNLSFETVLHVHIGSILALGLLYELPEFLLDLYSVWMFQTPSQNISLSKLKRIISIRYFITQFIGSISGVMAVASGLSLVHLRESSFLEGWLFWVVPLSAIFVCKGFFHHNLYTRTLYYAITRKNYEIDIHDIRRMIQSPFDVILNLSELPGFLFIFFAACCKPLWPIPWLGVLQNIETELSSKALIGIVIFIAVSLLVTPFLAWAMTRWSVCANGDEFNY